MEKPQIEIIKEFPFGELEVIKPTLPAREWYVLKV
jgi:hypothetical protein